MLRVSAVLRLEFLLAHPLQGAMHAGALGPERQKAPFQLHGVGRLLAGGVVRRVALRGGTQVFGFVRIDDPGHQVAQLHLPGAAFLEAVQQVLHGRQVIGHQALDFAAALFDAAGDADFAFPGQQFHRTHLAHVQAHRIGGSAQFDLERADRVLGLVHVAFVGGFAFGQRQGVRIRNLVLLVHLDVHVAQHVDDLLDLLHLDDLVGGAGQSVPCA